PLEDKTKTVVQVLLPVSVSQLVSYNYNVQKILSAYEIYYLKLNYHSILQVYKKSVPRNVLSTTLKRIVNNIALVGMGIAALATILGSIGMLHDGYNRSATVLRKLKKKNKPSKSYTLLESEKGNTSIVPVTSLQLPGNISISVMSIVAVEEFTTKDKIFAYGIAKNKDLIKVKEKIRLSEVDEVVIFEHSKPIYVLTDVEYNRENFDEVKDKADFVIVDSANDTIRMTITTADRIVPIVLKLSDVLDMKKYEEVDISTLTALAQKLKQAGVSL
ncbi:MAG: hypothetical protein QW806_09240, partial [Nitrososphaerota archaeon]